jgi:hypothetical protein
MVTKFLAAAAAAAVLVAAGPAAAATLFKGTGIISSVTGTNSSCAKVFAVGDDFQAIYRPRVAFLPLPETLFLHMSDGGMIVTNLDTTDPTLRTGTARIQASMYGLVRSADQALNIAIAPFPVPSNASLVTMVATIVNAGMPSCNVGVTIRLLPVNTPVL